MIATATASHSPFLTGSLIERQGGINGNRIGGGGYGSSSAATEGSSREGNGVPLERTNTAGSQTVDSSDEAPPLQNQSMTRTESNIPSRMYVRALYNYSTDDATSLSFNQGDVIQVLKQLDSGWWDGIIHNQRGWFPSNYCQLISHNDYANGNTSPLDESDLDEDDSYDEYDDEDDDSEHDGLASPGLPLEGTEDKGEDEAAFWIPQATPDGRLYYFNTNTGVFRSDLPLDAPTSSTETGPRDRTAVNVPDITRPPPELLAQGYEQEETSFDDRHDEDVDSVSGGEGDIVVVNGNGNGVKGHTHRPSETTLVDSSGALVDPARGLQRQVSPSMSESTETTAVNSIIAPSIYTGASAAAASPTYYDEGTPVPQSWAELFDRTGHTVERYRRAVNAYDRAQYVRRAEDISDMLRLLIAAGSATTDNHSGQPSIISNNRTLNPHFRHFMAAFSKLVLSSHVAATECRPPDAESKCLAEADEVMVGVFGFVETAKAQRGEQLPRLKPGFIRGTHAGNGWRSVVAPLNSPKSPKVDRVAEIHQIPLDSTLTDNMEDLNDGIKKALKQLDATLELPSLVCTAREQEILGENIISAARMTYDALKRYFNLIENIAMLPLNQAASSPSLMDFVIHKQRLHDSVADLFMGCQSVTAPLTDEWSSVRGETLEERLAAVRTYIREVEGGIRTLNFSTQLLVGERETHESVKDPAADWGTLQGRSQAVPGPTSQGHMQRPSQADAKLGNGVPSKVTRLLGETPGPVEKPKYLQCDHDQDIVYSQKGQVKGGSLVALVERLTRHDNLDSGFNTTFLLTYPSFVTAQELFNQLVRRFTIQPPNGISGEQYNEWVEQKQKLIRMRVLSILKMWLESNWMEENDEKSKELLRKMFTFAKEVMLPQLIGTQQVLLLIETRLRGQGPENKRLVLTMSSQPPQPILPGSRGMRKLKFLDIDALEFARQLTILESKSYAKLKAVECLSKGWSKQPNGGPDPAENIRAIITQSNQLTNWVAEMILTQTEVRKRVLVIKHFVNVAEKCRTLNNFSTLTSILAALQTSAIHRLKRTWETVPQRTQQQLAGLNTLMGASMNFADYRENLHLVNPPCVPFLGVYLKDLTFVADGNDDFIKGTELINYGKRVKTSNIIQEIQQYQAVPYALTPVPELQDFIVSSMQAARDVNDMYGVSLNLEPREREDEKIARYGAPASGTSASRSDVYSYHWNRLLQESGFL